MPLHQSDLILSSLSNVVIFRITTSSLTVSNFNLYSFLLAVESELLEQRRSLALQRKEYFKKASTIKDELGKLKRQQIELSHEKSGSEVDKILKQNKKFQVFFKLC